MTIQEIIDQRKAEQATRQTQSNSNDNSTESTDDDDDIQVDEVDITTLKVAAGSGK